MNNDLFSAFYTYYYKIQQSKISIVSILLIPENLILIKKKI